MCCWKCMVSTFYFYLLLFYSIRFFRIYYGSTFYFLESRKFWNYFYFLQSRILGKYLYFQQSNKVIYFWQHWKCGAHVAEMRQWRECAVWSVDITSHIWWAGDVTSDVPTASCYWWAVSHHLHTVRRNEWAEVRERRSRGKRRELWTSGPVFSVPRLVTASLD